MMSSSMFLILGMEISSGGQYTSRVIWELCIPPPRVITSIYSGQAPSSASNCYYIMDSASMEAFASKLLEIVPSQDIYLSKTDTILQLHLCPSYSLRALWLFHMWPGFQVFTCHDFQEKLAYINLHSPSIDGRNSNNTLNYDSSPCQTDDTQVKFQIKRVLCHNTQVHMA